LEELRSKAAKIDNMLQDMELTEKELEINNEKIESILHQGDASN